MNTEEVRAQFPALGRLQDEREVVHLDGPGGTQVPKSVIDAISRPLIEGQSNLSGAFSSSVESNQVMADARSAVADLFNARPDEIVFGQNMTSLTFAVSRAIATTWEPGDEIVLTRLDHDANVAPWLRAAEERAVEVKWVGIRDFGLNWDDLDAALGPRTRLVAVTAASNALGSIVDVAEVTRRAHEVGALTYVDGVHYTQHELVDVAAFDTDFFVCSAYKFYGPHTGMLYGKTEHLEGLPAYQVRPALVDEGPGRWQTGTQSFESLAGVVAAVDYLASLGAGDNRRQRLTSAFSNIGEYEGRLTDRFLSGLTQLKGVTLHGLRGGRRTPTFAVEFSGRKPRDIAVELAQQGIFVTDGDYYALEVMKSLGHADTGGLVRLGFVHYNTEDEVDRTLSALEGLAVAIPGGKRPDPPQTR